MASRGFHGLEQSIRVFGGARGVRVIHPPGQVIGKHRHEWPFLMLPLLGACLERWDGGEYRVAGPSAVLHPAGTCHANCIGNRGMESLSIEFDSAWVRQAGLGVALEGSRRWVGGNVGASARALAAKWRDASRNEAEVAGATAVFLRLALAHDTGTQPGWLGHVLDILDASDVPPTVEIARRLNLHPAWLARSYRCATGEGLHETVRRKRMESAIVLLRTTESPLSDIALATGFCDQSHMNRTFKAVAGRTPLAVRAERIGLRGFDGTANAA